MSDAPLIASSTVFTCSDKYFVASGANDAMLMFGRLKVLMASANGLSLFSLAIAALVLRLGR